MKNTAAKYSYFALVFLTIGCKAQEDIPITPSIITAEKAVMQLDHQEAVRLFEGVFRDEQATLKDRAEAGRKLARMQWHLFDRLAEARELLAKTLALDAEKFKTYLVRSEIEREAGKYDAAREAAHAAMREARSRYETHDAYIAFSQTVMQEAMQNVFRVASDSSDDAALDHALLREAFALIDSVTTEAPGQIVPSETLMGLALLLENGPKAFRAWRSYYGISDANTTTGLMQNPANEFVRILSSWNDQNLSQAEKERLILALAGSRFYDFAVMLANLLLDESSRKSPKINQIIAYHSYLQKIKTITTTFYKASALKKQNRDAFKEHLEAEARNLWQLLHWQGKQPDFSMGKFYSEISKRFGTEVRLMEVAGYYGLNMGHRVIDETRVVEQYGRKAELRFVSLDFMVSNGYTSWFWDGRAQSGGWAQSPKITQVRRAYSGGGLRAWKMVADSLERKETLQQIATLEAADDSIARKNPHAYLPGLALRLKFKVRQKLVDRLKAQGLQGTVLRDAFVVEYERRNLESSIFAHEGRHALDRQEFFGWMRLSANKEFNAKLSEVAFATDPFQAMLGGIIISTIGAPTSHGKANARIMKGIVDWMQQHSAEIAGLDSNRPFLPQLDLLTDEQLKQIFRSMDGMAN